jgi:hypothetical protein
MLIINALVITVEKRRRHSDNSVTNKRTQIPLLLDIFLSLSMRPAGRL